MEVRVKLDSIQLFEPKNLIVINNQGDIPN